MKALGEAEDILCEDMDLMETLDLMTIRAGELEKEDAAETTKDLGSRVPYVKFHTT